jgi:hypothetical protein
LAFARGHFKGRLREQRFDVGVNDGHGNLLRGLVARYCVVLLGGNTLPLYVPLVQLMIELIG